MIRNGLSVEHADAMTVNPDTQNIFIVDNQHTILKISPSGKPLLHIKKIGKGPGELLWAKQIKVRNGKLYVYDAKQNKISIFTLKGEFIRDLIPNDGTIHAFDVTSEGYIIIPNLYRTTASNDLFKIINMDGQTINEFGNNKIIQDDLKKTDMLGIVKLSLSPSGKLLLTFSVPGTFYLYDLDAEKLVSKFNIRSGPEWEERYKKKREQRKGVYSHMVSDVAFAKEHILVSTGGFFKDKISIGMIFNMDGEFSGRIFGGDNLKNPPNNLYAFNDYTILISGFNEQLNQLLLRKTISN